MKINYFFRKFNHNQISIEKLFDTIIYYIEKSEVTTKKIINPFSFSLRGVIKSFLFFKKNRGQINHITGDIHWASLALNSKNTILTIHDLVGMREYKGAKKWFYFLFWVFLPIKKAKYITAISDKTRDEIVKLMPSAASKITVIPNLLPIEYIRENFTKQNKILNVLIVGTRNNKNVERIFEAFAEKKIELTIIGALNSFQLKQLEENGLFYNNFINISEEELLNYYDKADVLCFPSLYEGFGLPVLEAQARNCAVITSNISPLKEIAGNGAILVNPYNVQEIREALEILENEKIRLNLIIKGKDNLKNYLPEIIAQKYMILYHQILNEKS